MRDVVDGESILVDGVRVDVSFSAQELDAVTNEPFIHDECDTAVLGVAEARATHLHADADVQLEESLHAVEVPGVDGHVVDG